MEHTQALYSEAEEMHRMKRQAAEFNFKVNSKNTQNIHAREVQMDSAF